MVLFFLFSPEKPFFLTGDLLYPNVKETVLKNLKFLKISGRDLFPATHRLLAC